MLRNKCTFCDSGEGRSSDENFHWTFSGGFTVVFSRARSRSNNLSDPAVPFVRRHCVYPDSRSVRNGLALLPTQTDTIFEAAAIWPSPILLSARPRAPFACRTMNGSTVALSFEGAGFSRPQDAKAFRSLTLRPSPYDYGYRVRL